MQIQKLLTLLLYQNNFIKFNAIILHDKISDEIILNKSESKHIVKILRKKKNDIIFFTNGKGFLFEAIITKADVKNCILKVLNKTAKTKQRNYHLHIGIAPTKNIEDLNGS